MLTQNNLASNVEAVKITAEPGTAMLSVLPIHHAFCLVMDWMKGFSQGATLCINDSLLHMIRNMSIFGTKYRFKWQAIAFQLDIDITFAECLKTEIWQISARE